MSLVASAEVSSLFQSNPSIAQFDIHVRPGDFGVTIIGERVAAGGNGKTIEEAVAEALRAYVLQNTVVIDGVVLAPQPLEIHDNWIIPSETDIRTDEQTEVVQ